MKKIMPLLLLFASMSSVYAFSRARLQGNCEQGNQAVQVQEMTSLAKVMKSYPACTATVYVTGSSGVSSGKYTSGGSITGSAGQTCSMAFIGGRGTGAMATVALTGTNTIAASSALAITANGNGYTSTPARATLGNGTATCSGTAVVNTIVGPNKASLYLDDYGTTLENPFTADATGHWNFYADNGRYDVLLSAAGITTPFTLSDNSLFELRSYFINVKNYPYYAKCDALTDDSTSIQEAINAAAAVGASVYFPSGKCIANITVTLPVTLFTESAIWYHSTITIASDNVEVRGFSFVGTATIGTGLNKVSSGGGTAITISGAAASLSNIKITKCKFQQFLDGINFSGPALPNASRRFNDIMLTDLDFYYITRAPIHLGGVVNLPALGTDFRLYRSTIDRISMVDIGIDNLVATNAGGIYQIDGTVIDHCVISNIVANSVHIALISASDIRDTAISNIQYDGYNATYALYQESGIEITDGSNISITNFNIKNLGYEAIILWGISNTTISNGTINNTSVGVQFKVGRAASEYCYGAITNVIFQDIESPDSAYIQNIGIYLEGPSERVSIFNCIFRKVLGHQAEIGISLFSHDLIGTQISNCQFYGLNYGIQSAASGDPAQYNKGLTVQGSYFSSCAYGLFSINSKDGNFSLNTFHDNTIVDITLDGITYGAILTGNHHTNSVMAIKIAEAHDCQFENSIFADVKSVITFASVGNILNTWYGNNILGTSSLDMDQLAINAQYDVVATGIWDTGVVGNDGWVQSSEITVKGALMTGFVQVGAPATLAGAIVTAYVSNANKVKLVIFNHSGVDVHLNGTWYIRVSNRYN
jgi:hypothetical protein